MRPASLSVDAGLAVPGRVGRYSVELSHSRPFHALVSEPPADPSMLIDLHHGIEVGMVLNSEVQTYPGDRLTHLGLSRVWL